MSPVKLKQLKTLKILNDCDFSVTEIIELAAVMPNLVEFVLECNDNMVEMSEVMNLLNGYKMLERLNLVVKEWYFGIIEYGNGIIGLTHFKLKNGAEWKIDIVDENDFSQYRFKLKVIQCQKQ